MSDEPRALQNRPSLAASSEQCARLVEAATGEQEINAKAVPGPQLDLEKLRRSATSKSSALTGKGSSDVNLRA
jgi:hypothetical protein